MEKSERIKIFGIVVLCLAAIVLLVGLYGGYLGVNNPDKTDSVQKCHMVLTNHKQFNPEDPVYCCNHMTFIGKGIRYDECVDLKALSPKDN